MRFTRQFLSFFALSLQFSQIFGAPTPVEDSTSHSLEPRGHKYVTVDQRLFKLDGKKTSYFAGKDKSHLFTNDDVDTALDQICATGLKVLRVWGFGTTNDASKTQDVYYQVLNSSGQYFNYNTRNGDRPSFLCSFLQRLIEPGIARLDYAVAAAEQRGIKLILPFLNNFDDLGGINTYSNVYGGDHNSFYTNAAAQKAFKKYIKFIVSRYKASPAVFSWELCNEPRCRGCSPDVVHNWAAATSAYIKSLDKKHPVCVGDEGWLQPSTPVPNNDGSYAYSNYEGVDSEKLLSISTIDFGTFHMYPNQWGYNYTWGNTWIEQHNLIGKRAGKPMLLEEYAVPQGEDRKGIMGKWQDTIVTKTSVAGDMFWQFGTRFPSGNNPFDEYALYYDTTAGSDFDVLARQHAQTMAAKQPVATL
ncbi:MAG: hypothetical protein LQ351_001297 [Letrouitia transgressa]|nr:MAG: hypothetical protein LQ351_001297 [Letrouitia transgressa]